MSAVVIAIADAVVAALNGATLGKTFTAVRRYVPVTDLKDLETLKVTVVPATLDLTTLDRTPRHLFDYAIDVGVQQKLPKEATTPELIAAFCDPLVLFTQAIVDLFRGQPLAGSNCVAVANMPIFDPKFLDDERVFVSVVRLTFRLGR